MDITKAELIILSVIWDMVAEGRSKESIIMVDITQRCNSCYGKEWKTQTVSTFLARLVKKNVLVKTRTGRKFYYESKVTKQDVVKSMLQEYADVLTKGNVEALIAIGTE